ncbi:hypothetical protein CANARDRAFT_29587 [[Candida] arabinofermentans NRRL YB-2248]|uniref:Tom7-domain-containing protein n=1 Tax=[Candida] arabinofermentans NRRL YB-2248 TaxID=983967 RepID=A0A1E4SWH6_9ASCO|nr:hypothetical protein CANARDRAFT_29587 [[Candida] arabinofermentans NRRL YB-2248]
MSGLNLSEESKERFGKVIESSKNIAHYAWLPLILYLGWQSTSNKPSLINLLSPLPTA